MPNNNTIIHQLEDKDFNPLAPSTVAKGVMFDYGVNLQKQINYCCPWVSLIGVVIDENLIYRSEEGDWSYVISALPGQGYYVEAEEGKSGYITFVKSFPVSGASAAEDITARYSYTSTGRSGRVPRGAARFMVITHNTHEDLTINEPKECEIGGFSIFDSDIERDKVKYINTLSGQTDECIFIIQDVGFQYRIDIDALREEVDKLDNEKFPLQINCSITPDFTNSQYKKNVSINIKEYDDEQTVLKSGLVRKSINGGNYHDIYIMSGATNSFTDNIEGSKEVLEITASTQKKTANALITKYLCFYGADSSEEMTFEKVMNLNKTLTTGVPSNLTIETHEGDYIWIVIPDFLTINSVKSSGFDVTLYTTDPEGKTLIPQTLPVGSFGTYKAYRTLNALGENMWNLQIK